MDNKIRETQRRRFQFLLKLFELSNGNELFDINAFELGDQLGFPQDETNRIFDYLLGENLIQHVASTHIAITHYGIKEIEIALTKPDEPTTYFPPVNIVHVEKMIGSQIQQGTTQSTQVSSYSFTDLDDVRKFIYELKGQLNSLQLDKTNLAQAKSDIKTIENQVKSPRPKSIVLLECLKSLRTILEGTVGSLIAAGLLQQLGALIK
jgi:hypothetical protein